MLKNEMCHNYPWLQRTVQHVTSTDEYQSVVDKEWLLQPIIGWNDDQLGGYHRLIGMIINGNSDQSFMKLIINWNDDQGSWSVIRSYSCYQLHGCTACAASRIPLAHHGATSLGPAQGPQKWPTKQARETTVEREWPKWQGLQLWHLSLIQKSTLETRRFEPTVGHTFLENAQTMNDLTATTALRMCFSALCKAVFIASAERDERPPNMQGRWMEVLSAWLFGCFVCNAKPGLITPPGSTRSRRFEVRQEVGQPPINDPQERGKTTITTTKLYYQHNLMKTHIYIYIQTIKTNKQLIQLVNH